MGSIVFYWEKKKKMKTTILGLGCRDIAASILGSTLGSPYVEKLPFLPSTVVSMLTSLKSHVKTAARPTDLLTKSP